jgi:ubiquinol-cytochrome c reductase cytochrome b subunit
MPAMSALDERLGVSPGARKLMRYVFPDHWSFMLGEVALYSFVVLVLTGIFLTFFYVPSDATTVYRGPTTRSSAPRWGSSSAPSSTSPSTSRRAC